MPGCAKETEIDSTHGGKREENALIIISEIKFVNNFQDTLYVLSAVRLSWRATEMVA